MFPREEASYLRRRDPAGEGYGAARAAPMSVRNGQVPRDLHTVNDLDTLIEVLEQVAGLPPTPPFLPPPLPMAKRLAPPLAWHDAPPPGEVGAADAPRGSASRDAEEEGDAALSGDVEEGGVDEADLERLTVPELKERCKAAGLKVAPRPPARLPACPPARRARPPPCRCGAPCPRRTRPPRAPAAPARWRAGEARARRTQVGGKKQELVERLAEHRAAAGAGAAGAGEESQDRSSEGDSLGARGPALAPWPAPWSPPPGCICPCLSSYMQGTRPPTATHAVLAAAAADEAPGDEGAAAGQHGPQPAGIKFLSTRGHPKARWRGRLSEALREGVCAPPERVPFRARLRPAARASWRSRGVCLTPPLPGCARWRQVAYDGGLLVPTHFPDVRPRLADWAALDAAALATEVAALFVGRDTHIQDVLPAQLEESFAAFPDPSEPTPLAAHPDSPGVHVLELFHGPSGNAADVWARFTPRFPRRRPSPPPPPRPVQSGHDSSIPPY
jgi:hypothetical protein